MTTALGRATGVVFRLIVVDAEVAFAECELLDFHSSATVVLSVFLDESGAQ